MPESGKFNIGFNHLRGPAAVISASAALAISASAAEAPVRGPQTTPVTNNSSEPEPKLIFDDLRRGEHSVQVFASPYTTKKDRKVQEYFDDGDPIGVDCRVIGRLVVSRPSRGERERRSREWYKVHATWPRRWASATYVRNLRQLRQDPRIKTCP